MSADQYTFEVSLTFKDYWKTNVWQKYRQPLTLLVFVIAPPLAALAFIVLNLMGDLGVSAGGVFLVVLIALVLMLLLPLGIFFNAAFLSFRDRAKATRYSLSGDCLQLEGEGARSALEWRHIKKAIESPEYIFIRLEALLLAWPKRCIEDLDRVRKILKEQLGRRAKMQL